jgi:toxin CcdB
MGQFDVYENPNVETNQVIPYLLDIQADILASLKTRVVIPLVNIKSAGKPIKHLNPRFTIEQTTLIMSTAELAGVPASFLGSKVASLKDRRDEIIAALDFLFTGF